MPRTVQIPFVFEARVTFNGGGSALPYGKILDILQVETGLSDEQVAKHFDSVETLKKQGDIRNPTDLDGGILAPSDRQVHVHAIMALVKDLEYQYGVSIPHPTYGPDPRTPQGTH